MRQASPVLQLLQRLFFLVVAPLWPLNLLRLPLRLLLVVGVEGTMVACAAASAAAGNMGEAAAPAALDPAAVAVASGCDGREDSVAIAGAAGGGGDCRDDYVVIPGAAAAGGCFGDEPVVFAAAFAVGDGDSRESAAIAAAAGGCSTKTLGAAGAAPAVSLVLAGRAAPPRQESCPHCCC